MIRAVGDLCCRLPVKANRSALVVAVVALAYFTLMALYRIHLPGLYYDEAIFVPVSLRTLGECNLDAAVGHSLGCFPVR